MSTGNNSMSTPVDQPTTDDVFQKVFQEIVFNAKSQKLSEDRINNIKALLNDVTMKASGARGLCLRPNDGIAHIKRMQHGSIISCKTARNAKELAASTYLNMETTVWHLQRDIIKMQREGSNTVVDQSASIIPNLNQ